jgi:hypothetical protein
MDRHCIDGDVDATLVAATENHSHSESGTTSASGSPTTTESESAETSSAESGDAESAAAISSKIGQAGVLLSACLLAYAAYAF